MLKERKKCISKSQTEHIYEHIKRENKYTQKMEPYQQRKKKINIFVTIDATLKFIKVEWEDTMKLTQNEHLQKVKPNHDITKIEIRINQPTKPT